MIVKSLRTFVLPSFQALVISVQNVWQSGSLHVSHLEVGMAHRHVSLQCQADGQQDRAWNKDIYAYLLTD